MHGTTIPVSAPSALAMSAIWRVLLAVGAVLAIWGAVDWALS